MATPYTRKRIKGELNDVQRTVLEVLGTFSHRAWNSPQAVADKLVEKTGMSRIYLLALLGKLAVSGYAEKRSSGGYGKRGVKITKRGLEALAKPRPDPVLPDEWVVPRSAGKIVGRAVGIPPSEGDLAYMMMTLIEHGYTVTKRPPSLSLDGIDMTPRAGGSLPPA